MVNEDAINFIKTLRGERYAQTQFRHIKIKIIDRVFLHKCETTRISYHVYDGFVETNDEKVIPTVIGEK